MVHNEFTHWFYHSSIFIDMMENCYNNIYIGIGEPVDFKDYLLCNTKNENDVSDVSVLKEPLSKKLME